MVPRYAYRAPDNYTLSGKRRPHVPEDAGVLMPGAGLRAQAWLVVAIFMHMPGSNSGFSFMPSRQ